MTHESDKTDEGDTMMAGESKHSFTEQTLMNEICAVWGAYGAHADLFQSIVSKAGGSVVAPPQEQIERRRQEIMRSPDDV